MYGTDERDLCRTISEMHKTAVERASYDQVAAREILKGYLAADRRFDPFDPDRLVARTEEARSCGRTMDLFDDPYLRRGGQERPIPLRTSRY